MNTLIKIIDAEKTYKEKKALNRLCVEIREGEVLAIIGPNGAGHGLL